MENDLRRYVEIVWHRAWLIGLGVCLAAGVAFLSSKFTTPIYAAQATLLVNQAPSSATGDYASILIKSDRLAQTYTDMMTQQPVLDKVIAQLQLGVSLTSLENQVKVTPIKDTQLIRLTVENENPQLAADIANTIPIVFGEQNAALQAQRYAESRANLTADLETISTQIEQTQAKIAALGLPSAGPSRTEADQLQAELVQLRQIYSSLRQSYENIGLTEAQSTSNLVVTEPAQPAQSPVRPKTLQNTLVGALVGLLLALGVTFLIEYLDNSIRTPEQIERALAVPLIGVIAHENGKTDKPASLTLTTATSPRSPVAEAYRALRTTVQIAGVDGPIRTLLVTSAGPAEGKSTVAANLGVVMAQAGREVVVVDADLRRPCIHRFFDQRQPGGLTDTLLGDRERWSTALTPTSTEHLMTVTSGSVPPNPSELLGSKRMQEFIEFLKGRSETIVLDTPPLLVVTDALVLAPQVDGVIVVVQHGRTHLKAAQQVVTQLQQAGARVLGVVLNQVPVGRRGYGYGYGYGYTYYYRHSYSNDDGAAGPAAGPGPDKPGPDQAGGEKAGLDKTRKRQASTVAEAKIERRTG